ncbi:MAG: c-type cytochrome [Arenimonas sp.]
MKKLLKFLAYTIGLLLVIVLGFYGYAHYNTEQGLAKRYEVNDKPLVLANDAATLAYGARLFIAKGCADCHAANAQGKLVFDGGPVIKLIAPNLTAGGVGQNLTADDIARAIRHGVGQNGRPLVFMPSTDYKDLSDADTAAIISHIKSLPVSDNQPGTSEIRPLGRIMYTLHQFPLLQAEDIDHSPRDRLAPPAAVTAEYGKYLAQTCVGCHGENFAGQHVPGTPPEFKPAANLTQAALKNWTQKDFQTALRTGKRPDGSAIDPFMPWPALSTMTDDEIAALWVYISGLPPVENKPK